MIRKEITIRAERKNGKTIVSNNRGDKWECLGNMPEGYSIRALVNFTFIRAIDDMMSCHNRFKVEMIITELEDEKSKV